jgi:hypothetical protein
MNRIIKRFLSSDRLENELRKMVMKEKREDLVERISIVWTMGVIPSGLIGSGFGVWQGIKETRYESIYTTTFYASGLGLIGGMAGVLSWTVSPIIAPVMVLSYLDKKRNKLM